MSSHWEYANFLLMQGGCSQAKTRYHKKNERGPFIVLPTKIRRTLQPLWTKLDMHLAPFMHDGVLLAVSGGPDSRALLECLARWPKRHTGRFVIATCDHGMRLASSEEARLVRMRAMRLGFDALEISFVPLNLSEQELRTKRYQSFAAICRQHNLKTICTAHHKDDDREGYLMSLFGTGGGSLGASMSEVSNHNGLHLVRPFLGLEKNDLRLALSMLGINDYASDSLDEKRVGARAYVRLEVLPDLKKHAPAINARLSYFAQQQAKYNKLVNDLASQTIEWSGDDAYITVTNPLVTDSAICQALKKISPGKDVRQSRPTREKVINYLFEGTKEYTFDLQGLDRTVKEINVKTLKKKEYSLPGALLITIGTKIALKRV